MRVENSAHKSIGNSIYIFSNVLPGPHFRINEFLQAGAQIPDLFKQVIPLAVTGLVQHIGDSRADDPVILVDTRSKLRASLTFPGKKCGFYFGLPSRFPSQQGLKFIQPLFTADEPGPVEPAKFFRPDQ